MQTETRKLVACGAWCGVGASIIYFSAMIYVLLSPAQGLAEMGADPFLMPAYFYLSASGMLGIVFLLGLYRLLSLDKPPAIAFVGVVFGCIGFTVLTAMLVVQGTVMSMLGRQYLSATGEAKEAVLSLYYGLRSLDLGLDLVWDIFISVAIVLLSISMLKNKNFGLFYGVAGMVAGGGLLVINILTAPVPPAGAGHVDLGPVIFLWFLLVGIRMARALKQQNTR